MIALELFLMFSLLKSHWKCKNKDHCRQVHPSIYRAAPGGSPDYAVQEHDWAAAVTNCFMHNVVPGDGGVNPRYSSLAKYNRARQDIFSIYSICGVRRLCRYSIDVVSLQPNKTLLAVHHDYDGLTYELGEIRA